MKTIKVTCDRCKQEFTTEKPTEYTLILYKEMQKRLELNLPSCEYDLCDDCIEVLRVFLKEEQTSSEEYTMTTPSW